MKIAELFAEIGFKWDSVKLHEVTTMIADLNLASLVGATSVVGLGLEIKKLMERADKTTQTMLNFKEATGIDTTRAQQFRVFAEEFGASADEANDALVRLNKLRMDVLQGNGNPQPFILTGLVPTTETLELLDQIHSKFNDTTFLQNWAGAFAKNAKSIEEMKQAWKSSIAEQFGFSSNLLRSLSSTNAEWNSMRNIITFTNSEFQNMSKAHQQYVLATHDLNIEWEKMVTNLAPLVTMMAKLADGLAHVMNSSIGMQNLQAIPKIFDSVGNWFSKSNVLPSPVAGISNSSQVSKQQTNNWNITIQAADVQDFVHKFDNHFKRYLANADIQFGTQT